MVRVVVLCGLVGLAIAAVPAIAQPPTREPAPLAPPAQPTTAPPASTHVGGVVESKLGPIYVRDQNGALVPYPSITLEELERLQDLKQRQRSVEPPRFTFSAAITGTVSGTAADLEIKLQVQLNKPAQPADVQLNKSAQLAEDWVRIPLRLNQAFLLPPVTHGGTGEFLIEFVPKGDGYVVWLRAAPGSSHTFAIRLKAPLLLKNASRQLVLATPDTPTSLRLVVPGNGTEARINGNVGNILTTHRGMAGQTELVVDAAGGDIDLSWRELDELPPVLAAFGNVVISFDGHQFEFDAQLNVRSYGPPIDSFTVRLPPGTELIGTNMFTQPGLEYSPLPESAGNGAGRRVVVRRLEGKTAGLIEARLRCHTNGTTLNSAAPWQQLAGFDVIDAKHQKGTIDFQVDGDWSIDWLTDANIRRVDDLPDVSRQQRLAARFEYDRQPFSLQTLIREKETRITVEPMWLVSVEAQRLALEGTLKYRISGARAKPLRLNTGGWNIQQVTPAELVAGNWHVDDETLTVPLSTTVPNAAGEFELHILATREHSAAGSFTAAAARWPRFQPSAPSLDFPLPPVGPASLLQWKLQEQSSEVAFPLPRPVSDAGLAALVIISPDDNIELSPSTDQLRSLVNDTLPPEIKQTRQQKPLVYREDVGGEPAAFVGQFRVRRQSIGVAVESRVKIEERETVVEQRFAHTISYDPVRQLHFLVPRSLVESSRLELLLDGMASTWTRHPAEQGVPAAQVPVTIDLRDPRLGSCDVVFRYRQPRGRPPHQAPLDLKVPLIQVATDETTTLSSHRLRVTAPANLAITLPEDQWSVVTEEGANTAPGEMLFESDDLPTDVQLAVTQAASPTKRSTDVQRVWVQSLLTPQERRDRACFRLSTNEQSLTFRLPRGAVLDDITVAINGQRTDRCSVSPQGELRVDLGDAIGARETTVEMWYWFTVQPVALGRLVLQAPILDGATRADRVYWQLLLPRHEHLAWYPAELTTENSWEREHLLWSRRPHRSQAELEQWASASSQPDLVRDVPAGFNSYLFSSVGSLAGKTVYTVTRQLAVLSIAGLVLLTGAMLLYVPALRHPLLLLAAGVVVGACAIVFPEPALAAAQLIALGLALVLLTGMLMSLVSRPMTQRSTVRAITQPAPDSRSSKQPSARLVSANSHVTTATLQTQVPLSAAGNEP